METNNYENEAVQRVDVKQKKPVKKGLIALIVIFIIACMAGGFVYGVYSYAEDELQQSNNFYFYDSDNDYSNKAMNKEDILAYESQYSKYSSKTYYSTLNDDEKLIYDTVVYAFENRELCIFIPECYAPSGDVSITDILFFVALDSPLVEQNIANSEGKDTSEITQTDLLGFTHKKEAAGTFLYIDNFSQEKMDYKLKAVEKAQEIVNGIPSDITTDEAKAKYFFHLIAEGSDYVAYSNDDFMTANFLYDTLVSNKSNCDGFTNAFSLLCNMSGIDCFEKMVNGENDEDGHTWNCIVIDGKYYNVDVTSAVDNEEYGDIEISYAYPDAYNDTDWEYRSILPECTDTSLSYFDYGFTTESNSEIAKKLASEYRANQGNYVCAHFTDMTQQRLDSITESFMNQIQRDIVYYTDEPVDGKLHTVIIEAQ